jgi:hypothetical protein
MVYRQDSTSIEKMDKVTEYKSVQSGKSARLIFSYLSALSENLLACCHSA